MKKTALPYLLDIKTSIDLIDQYLTEIDYSYEDFIGSLQLQDSLMRRLEIIGEATKRLEKGFREQYAKIPWREMSGLRDVLIHEYDEVDLDLIWLVVSRDLPAMKEELESIITQLSLEEES